MALTGVALVVFVLIHMIGNLAVFAGRDALNSYAAALQSSGMLLWVARIGLLAMVVIHIAAAARLVALNRAARPVKYVKFKPLAAPFYARVMPWTGLILIAFIVYHLLHFTAGAIMSDAYDAVDPQGRHDVYTMVVLGFQNAAVAISYIVAMAILCMHLAHGVSSMFQSLGLEHPKYNPLIARAGPAFATLIFIGNCSMPVAILAGVIKLPGA
jgi:succinate dehydrogenase / fumarate reductase cytochrome b subunit